MAGPTREATTRSTTRATTMPRSLRACVRRLPPGPLPGASVRPRAALRWPPSAIAVLAPLAVVTLEADANAPLRGAVALDGRREVSKRHQCSPPNSATSSLRPPLLPPVFQTRTTSRPSSCATSTRSTSDERTQGRSHRRVLRRLRARLNGPGTTEARSRGGPPSRPPWRSIYSATVTR
jgi:hypothetical protein